jgi:hypothetical protein
MITVFQPIWGTLPEKYKPYVESTIAFCKSIGAEYLSPALPEEYRDWNHLENVKDYMLYEYMAEYPYVLGVDWDIDLHSDFCIPDIEKPFRGPDVAALIYNGNDTETWKTIMSKVNEYPRELAKNEFCRAWKCANSYIQDHPIDFFDPKTFKHFPGS